MARRETYSHPSSNCIRIGNFEVGESYQDNLEISLSKTAKIRISVVEESKGPDDSMNIRSNHSGDYHFVLARSTDSDDQNKSILKEVLTLYMKELPAMKYAANTRKESTFLERCLTNGKYCTLILKSQEDTQPGEVIGAITYQIIPADTQYAEIPLAAVSSTFQHKGVGCMLYLELRKRLRSVGIQTLLCWGDKDSEGFWLKQGFKVIGEVDGKGRARKLSIKANIRKSLCFPGDSTLMAYHILEDNSSELIDIVKLPLSTKLPKLGSWNQENTWRDEALEGVNVLSNSQCSMPEKLLDRKGFVTSSQDLESLPATSLGSASGLVEGGDETNLRKCSCSVPGAKRKRWEASCTSLKSKKVKGTRSTDSQIGYEYPARTCYGKMNSLCNTNSLLNVRNNYLPDIFVKDPGSDGRYETNEDYIRRDNRSAAKGYRIMLMDMADDKKKASLTKVIEDLGGVVTSDGSISTHVIAGKVRTTMNFCAALSSGSWVVSPSWLKESFRAGRFVDEMAFMLEDEDYKTKYKNELKNAVFRAKQSPNSLLKGLDFWVGSQVVQPPPKTLSTIVKCSGGNVIWSQGEINDLRNTIFIACEEDNEEALLVLELGISTFSVDWLMNCIMRQELDLDAPHFAKSL